MHAGRRREERMRAKAIEDDISQHDASHIGPHAMHICLCFCARV
jgi:hypothetical protein